MNTANSNFYAHHGKHVLDLLVAATTLLLLSPLLAIVALLIRLRLGHPILFRQPRAGWRGKPFTLYKFRTMNDDSDAQGLLLPDAERLTPLGRFLRSTSLDELPEFFNVLKGDMSLVGPRPLLLKYLDRYTPEQARRHEIRPGITGWAQIKGRNGISWEQKFIFDVWYVDHVSFGLDLKILALTAWKTLQREGIHIPGRATTPEFLGKAQ